MPNPMAKADDFSSEATMALEDFITFRMLQLTNQINRQSVRFLDRIAGIRLPEWRCLAFIGQHGRISLNEITELTGMDRGLISRSIQGLVDKRLVVTKRDSNDRRVVMAMATQKGRAVFDELMPILQDRQSYLLNSLTAEERKSIYKITNQLMDALHQWGEKLEEQ